ncbi:MAG: UDP-N-acetylglucosamine 4,6-dehydratase (inverting) [Candidatus Staskawiczbacteria bacterium RIFCSPHIGHO2_02_FULL_34_10]|uniref:UDP-N-acetylglucosamine 4,6-dehydratase (Inverting) n=2 Tax=Candidatus Staskawicziibacteriota TaxID=1817916 RepID=A0A1G2HJE7_9BACT|nr:MAG: UDP-N-acetylglucosamine 4,6-dehydratase (inverting) [Candidatus Staskawiczbacteria bacterium RIFCSPHIGHO2_01_FULL_34_27]OGZ66723.1 MAG: UDP-N-acetylglucosamine 4,6-dehydratase (inverting) [Candidatus Staskawiczbacteria bacterium RIFCSPHIGHO2_02_FULL_34_10]
MSLDNKTILITGGTGSFGQKFTETVLKNHNPKAIRIFSRSEYLQWEMAQKFKDERLRFFIGDIRDKERLSRAMNGVDIVVHAAALKQVPIAEFNPMEAIKTNINGTANVVDVAIDNGVEKAILISTDKAVNPVNLYGATKLCAEKLFIQANAYVGSRKTKFSCVRYGNVVGSRGSVVPVFLEQKKTGTLTVTDEKMTRFWITLEQGVALVINSIASMYGGEIFIPKIPSMKIMDLVKVISPEAQVKITGIRPGEKLHEILLTADEARHSLEFDSYFIIEPEFAFWKKESLKEGKTFVEGFNYSSDNNTQWFKQEDFKKLVNEL